MARPGVLGHDLRVTAKTVEPTERASTERPPSAFELSDVELSELVELLSGLIRIKSVNPPGDEILAARYVEQVLRAEGIPSTVVEPFPGRASIVARVHGDGSGGDPLILLSHLDVVPADPAGWSHDPFGGEVADGYVWGRGALDMKSMVAMELQVMRRLARAARKAGRDPASDPIPGLRRDVIFCSSADEEAGGWHGANWLVNEHPDWLHAAAALNEAGGISMPYRGARFFPIQVAEKGFVVYKLHVRGRWGHGSVPTPDNAAVLAARVAERVSAPGRVRLTPAMVAALRQVVPRLVPHGGRLLTSVLLLATRLRPGLLDAGLRRFPDPAMARTVSALVHDTVSVGVIQAGVKYNVIPGTAEIEIDCRTLPGTDEPAMRAELRRRIGEELWGRIEVECEQVGPSAEATLDGAIYPLLEKVLREHDPDGVPFPFMAPWATDAKHLARIGVPTYGFSPLRMGAGEGLLDLMHADDERVSVAALRWGLPVLHDAVVRFCG
jgi:acetylornithine deacetylase/succinyl-diaminopimelate desuccinylase-like protein